jgi:hypothetical protein
MLSALRQIIQPKARTGRTTQARRPRLEAIERRELLATLTLPNTDLPTFTATFMKDVPNVGPIQVSGSPVSGGNFLGKLDTRPLLQSYCVNISQDIFTNTTYASASATGDGKTYGAAVPNAGAVAWLIKNIAPSATSTTQQSALQAAIWRTEYGTGFELDGVDNDNGAPSFNSQIGPTYQSYLARLGSNTTSLSSVLWISPGANPGQPPSQGQGLVALPGNPAPPPKTPPHVKTASVAGRASAGLTSLNVVFDKAMNSNSVKSVSKYQVLGGVTRKGHTTFPTRLAIRAITYNSKDNTATVLLTRPYKGPVQLTVRSGILASNGVKSTASFTKTLK